MAETLRDIIDDKDALEGLLKSRGWAVLIAFANEAREGMITSMLGAPCLSHEQMFAQEFAKGRCFEIKAYAGLPQAIIDNLSIDIANLNRELEEANARSPEPAEPESDTFGDNSTGPDFGLAP